MRRLLASLVGALLLGVVVPPASAAPGDPGRPITIDEGTGYNPLYLTDDSTTVVYVRPSVTGGAELVVAAVDGSGEPRRLNTAALVVNGPRFVVDEADRRVVYVGEVGGGQHLFAVGLDGSAERDLTPSFPAGVVIDSWTLTPDGTRVVFSADLAGPDRTEVFAVGTGGGAISRRNSALDTDRRVVSFTVTPDGAHVLYIADQDTNEKYELFVADVAGAGGGTQLSGVLGATQDVQYVRISLNGARAVFFISTAGSISIDLATVPLDGSGPPVLLTAGLTATEAQVRNLAIAPDGATVMFAATPVASTDVFVFRAPSDGSAAPDPVLPVPAGGILIIEFAGQSQTAVVTHFGAMTTVWAIDADDQITELLAPTEAPVQSVGLAPDGSRLVYQRYLADEDADVVVSVPVAGGPPRELARVVRPNGVVFAQLSSDGEHVVFVTGLPVNRTTAAGYQAYSVRVAGGEPLRIATTPGPMFPFVTSSLVTILVEGVAGRLLSVRLGYLCEGELATIVGTGEADTLSGTQGRDVIVGFGGDDTIIGRGGDDLVCGGGGADAIRGGGGDDTLLGQRGRDQLVGGRGPDTCIGGGGRDTARSCATTTGVP